MKRKVLILATLLICRPLASEAQKILTLRECYEKAIAANAIAGEKISYSRISEIKNNNLSKSWLPTLDANGSLLYNSSVIDMAGVLGSLPFPGIAEAIKPLPHEQYKITLDINQVIYDGGATKGARELEKADLSINEKQTESDLYKLRGQINSYYFSIMLAGKQKELLESYLNLLEKRISSMQSALGNGVLLRSDLDVLTSEKIKTEQQLSENETRKNSLLKVLSDLTGIEIDTSAELVMPAQISIGSDDLQRPELQLFDLRKEQLSAGAALINSKKMPKAFGFATFGYGNPPGSNFFRDEFAPYYIVGAGVKWNIFDWNKSKNEKQVIAIQSEIIENRKKDLSDNLRRQLELKKAEITNLEDLTRSDEELILIRKRISATAESQYQNGTITATEYLNILNSEKQALINSEIHKINLALAGIEYLNISGRDLE